MTGRAPGRVTRPAALPAATGPVEERVTQMGEYAYTEGRNGTRIKIGTCEDMYYLRADQAAKVIPDVHSVHPMTEGLRYRFPFPDEDHLAPGEFEDPFRAIAVNVEDVSGFDYDHGKVQFQNPAGLLVSLPCPESNQRIEGVTIARNGYAGNIRIVQQKRAGDQFWLVCSCGSCGSKFRLETLAAAQPIIDAVRAKAATYTGYHQDDSREQWWRTIADRIAAGYRDIRAEQTAAIARMFAANQEARMTRCPVPDYDPETDGDYSAWLVSKNID